MVSKEGKCCDNDGSQLDHCTHSDKSAISTAICVFEIFFLFILVTENIDRLRECKSIETKTYYCNLWYTH